MSGSETGARGLDPRESDPHQPGAPSSGPPPSRLDGAIARCFRGMELVIAACLALMVVMVFTNVVMRYVFDTGIAEGEELARLAFVWLIFIGAVLAMREHGHIGVDMVVRRLPPLGRKICLLINHALVLWALWLLGIGSWDVTVIGLDSVLPVTGISTAVFSASGLFLAVAMSALILVEVWRLLTGRITDAELVDVDATFRSGE